MKKNRIKPIKIPLSIRYIMLTLFGFGVGYITNEYAPTQKPYVQHQASRTPIQLKEGTTSVCFTPNKHCQSQIINEINKAKKAIYVQAYSFTDRDIAEALVVAAQRGVQVKVLLDKSNRNDKRSAKGIIIQNQIPLRFDSPPGIAHNKVMIIDQSTVISGSYNFSASAYTRNTENLLILNSPDLAKDYIHNWYKRWDVSKEGVTSHRQSSLR